MATLLRNLKLKENSLVDDPANPHAKVLLVKRAESKGRMKPTQTLKAVSASRAAASAAGLDAPLKKRFAALVKGYTDGEAMTTAESIEDQEERELICALWNALDSISNDDTLTEAEQAAMYRQSFDEFLTALTAVDAAAATGKEAGMPMDLTKVAPEVKAHIEKLEADLAAEKAARVEAEKAAEPAPKPEDVLKGLTPEARAMVEKAQEQAASATKQAEEANTLAKKLQDEGVRKEFVAKAAEFKALPAKADELGPALKEISEKAPEAYKEIDRLLKAADEQIQKGALFAQVGTSGAGGGSTAYEMARTKAQEMVTKGEAKTIEQGVSLVFKRDPKLYEQHRTEQKRVN